MQTCSYAPTDIQTHINTYKQRTVSTLVCMQIHTLTCTNARTYIYMCAHTHICTYIDPTLFVITFIKVFE